MENGRSVRGGEAYSVATDKPALGGRRLIGIQFLEVPAWK